MPKKHTYNFKQLQGASSSAANGKPGSSKNGTAVIGESASVNERLGELRKIEGSEAAQVKRELAEAVNQRSVPPQLRGILGVPESAPPKPKFGSRQRTGPRVAGPAPPESWLRARSSVLPSLSLRSRGKNLRRPASKAKDRNRPSQAWRFARITNFASDIDVDRSPASLLHLSLKALAQQWELFDEADYPALVDLDLRLRVRLLSYIGFYGPAINVKGFDALLQGHDPVQLLDLSGLLGHGHLTSARLVKCFKAQKSDTPDRGRVVESWDEDDTFEAALSTGLSVSRFSDLTHLSLSHPMSTVSWKDLLSLSKHIPKLTHLSLAYWPRPTLTPNLVTASVSTGRSPDVAAGGSHYYSRLDRDYSEPASLLRQLSANLLCLQWLDLEGCADWMPALTAHDEEPQVVQNGAIDPWLDTSSFKNVFLENWKNVKYLNCFQGWLPTKAGVDALPRQLMSSSERSVVLDFLKHEQQDLPPDGDDVDQLYEVAKRKAVVWVECETTSAMACSAINHIRRQHGLKPIRFDHGWREKIMYA